MKAKVTNIKRVDHPRVHPVTGEETPTPVIEIEVKYSYDDGDTHSTQKYAYTPDEFKEISNGMKDLKVFDRQAEIMQRDIHDSARQLVVKAQDVKKYEEVDKLVSDLHRHFQLEFVDEIPMNDKSGVTR